MGGRGRARMMEFARRPLLAVMAHSERARHAEVHEQHVAGGKVRREVFGAAADARDGLAFEPLHEVARQLRGQARAARFRPRGVPAPGASCSPWTGDLIAPWRLPGYGSGAQRINAMPAMNGAPDTPRNTHFGFRTVGLDDKQAMVDDVFYKVAPRYDLMNDLMSGGLHRVWKNILATAVNPPRNERPFAVLDVAGGTGDVAFRIAA